MSTIIINHDFVMGLVIKGPRFSPWEPSSARNLHKNPQILGIPDKCPANRPGIVAAWGKSSGSNFGRRDCPGGCSTTAGGWRRRFVLPSLPFQSHASGSPSPGAATSPSFIPGNNNMSIATGSDIEIAPTLAPARPILRPLLLAAACAALADWLFYGWEIGISLALFFGALGIVAVAGNDLRATRKAQIAMSAVLVAGLLAVVEDVNVLSVIAGALATAMFVIVLTARGTASWQRQLFEAATIPFRGPFQLAGDLFATLRRWKEQLPEWLRPASLVAWIVPLAAFAVFLGLFASANPLIEYRLMQIDLHALFNLVSAPRMLFWALIICLVWPLIHLRIRHKPDRASEPRVSSVADFPDTDDLFGAKAIARSLILFNGLFALQTGLDLAYLWGGATLPGGMSHAEYAHRGAYPLIVTALLAAGFVLIAMRPGGPAEHSRLIRPLVLAWIAQNILLVISAIFRLDLYVAAFSLTYLRLAAFIWMGLVAAGLLLILIKIAMRKPNSWLINANAATLAVVLYGYCFINAPWLVATYNVQHCREVGGTGPTLDLKYLASLGPQALPPIEAHMKEFPEMLLISLATRLDSNRDYLARPGNWRAWGFRAWRLERYFATYPPVWLNQSDSGKG
jgi:Domain of unknown function (DUF4173)